jgi:hypothetical protein
MWLGRRSPNFGLRLWSSSDGVEAFYFGNTRSYPSSTDALMCVCTYIHGVHC